ncbi:MAG: hypothetical protein IT463_12830 [Planctomycetes bacterium]|nr:hypothetical protein [Planctomycetota bacterium]
MHAELAYLFRHALLRDAAYQVQMPSDRARLHELAFYLIEDVFGGRAPEPPPLDAIDPPKMQPHPTDAVAEEPAWHARRALAPDTATGAAILREPGDKAELERQSATTRAACAKAGIAPFEEP